MLYALHEAAYYASSPLREAARVARDFWGSPLNPAANTDFGRRIHAGADLFTNVTRRYGKPAWNIDTIKVGQVDVRVRPTVVWESPWARVIQFDRDMADMRRAGKFSLDPAVLIVAPLSGHYATLLRGTVEAFLPDHAVFIVDWVNAREVSMLEGRFDFHDYIDHIIQMLAVLGPRPNVVAVCQPGPPVLAAAALMAEDNHPSR
ncbi:MAG TPA: polyhydroxyalkanoate depolymerase, partial [Caulobacter sp.]